MTASSSQILVGRAGVEPTTNGLKVERSWLSWSVPRTHDKRIKSRVNISFAILDHPRYNTYKSMT